MLKLKYKWYKLVALFKFKEQKNDCQAAIKVSGENKSNQVATQRFSYHKRQKVNINLNP